MRSDSRDKRSETAKRRYLKERAERCKGQVEQARALLAQKNLEAKLPSFLRWAVKKGYKVKPASLAKYT